MMQHSGLKRTSSHILTLYLPELSAIIQSLYELENVLHTGCLSQQSYPLLVKSLGLLQNVLFLREKEQVALLRDRLPLAYVLYIH